MPPNDSAYLTPRLEENGRALQGIEGAGRNWWALTSSCARAPGVCRSSNAIGKTARQCNLDKDVTLPEGEAPSGPEGRDSVVGRCLPPAWMENREPGCSPVGLHTTGKPPPLREAIATLVRHRALEREEEGLSQPAGPLIGRKPRAHDRCHHTAGNDAGVLARWREASNQTITRPCARRWGSMRSARSVTAQRWQIWVDL